MINITTNDSIAVNMAILTSRVLSIPFVDSKSLAANIVMYRLFGIEKDFALLCMLELSSRRAFDGESFAYESFIEEEVKKVNLTPQISIKNVSNAISTINSMSKSKKK